MRFAPILSSLFLGATASQALFVEVYYAGQDATQGLLPDPNDPAFSRSPDNPAKGLWYFSEPDGTFKYDSTGRFTCKVTVQNHTMEYARFNFRDDESYLSPCFEYNGATIWCGMGELAGVPSNCAKTW